MDSSIDSPDLWNKENSIVIGEKVSQPNEIELLTNVVQNHNATKRSRQNLTRKVSKMILKTHQMKLSNDYETCGSESAQKPEIMKKVLKTARTPHQISSKEAVSRSCFGQNTPMGNAISPKNKSFVMTPHYNSIRMQKYKSKLNLGKFASATPAGLTSLKEVCNEGKYQRKLFGKTKKNLSKK